MLQVIKGNDENLYELVAGNFRVAVYCVRREEQFILLHGWRKKGKSSPRDITLSRELLHEYLGRGG